MGKVYDRNFLHAMDMTPWFIATEPFTSKDGEGWDKYIAFSGLTQLTEVVSLDGALCPPILSSIEDDYWPHIVNEDFMLQFFVDFDFLMTQVAGIEPKNLLCVFRNPTRPPEPPAWGTFAFLGYDLMGRDCAISALTNCGGYPDVFSNSELSNVGLLPEFSRAADVQRLLRSSYPNDHHADCHLWAIFRVIE